MIQDIAPLQYRNEYQPMKPAEDSILLCYRGRNLLLRREGEEVVYPTFIEAVNAGVDEGDLYHTYTYSKIVYVNKTRILCKSYTKNSCFTINNICIH